MFEGLLQSFGVWVVVAFGEGFWLINHSSVGVLAVGFDCFGQVVIPRPFFALSEMLIEVHADVI